jgi:hypothetical protein
MEVRRFEVGKVYISGAMAFKITEKTAKSIKYREIYHYNRFNEEEQEEKKAKLYFNDIKNEEYFATSHYEVVA